MDRGDNPGGPGSVVAIKILSCYNERNEPLRGLKASVRPTRPGVRPRSATALRIQDSPEVAEPTRCVFRPRSLLAVEGLDGTEGVGDDHRVVSYRVDDWPDTR